jgi:hypothetical protein
VDQFFADSAFAPFGPSFELLIRKGHKSTKKRLSGVGKPSLDLLPVLSRQRFSIRFNQDFAVLVRLNQRIDLVGDDDRDLVVFDCLAYVPQPNTEARYLIRDVGNHGIARRAAREAAG